MYNFKLNKPQYILDLYAGYEERNNDKFTFLSIFFLASSIFSIVLIPQIYSITMVVVLFTHLALLTIFSIIQFFRMPPFTFGYKGRMTIEPEIVYIDNKGIPIAEIFDFSINFSTYKQMSKEDLYTHFTRLSHSCFQPKQNTGILDNVIKFTARGVPYEYLFYIDSKQQLRSFEGLIIMLAQNGLLSESVAVRKLIQHFSYLYSDVQRFKAALRSGEEISPINKGNIRFIEWLPVLKVTPD